MLKGCKILTSFCVICATLYGGAYGAASVRGGATSRAGSIRTLGAGTTASVKTTTARPQPNTVATVDTGNTETAGGSRMSLASGLGGSKLPGKVSGTASSSGDNQNVAELRQAIEQLRNDYDALGEQYNNLSSDISNVSDTAQVARDVAANNTNTLTVVRTDLSVGQSDIEDLKANGGFDEERVQEALNTTLAQKNYATRGELAATDAVARGAVQVADLPQRLNALNIADKDYVASQAQGAVNDSLNVTLGNYYTKGQVNDAIGQAKLGMVDKDYVDDQVRGLAPKNYVDAKVAAIEVGVNEDAVQGIVNNSIGTRLANYYTKGDIDDALVDAVADAKAGMADRDYVNNQVRDVTSYVDEKVAEVETGVDTGTLYNILETRGYKTGSEVQGIVRDSLNETMANYYTGAQVDTAIAKAKAGMVDRNQVDNMIDGLAATNWVTGQINTVNNRISALPLGLDQNAVKAVVEEYGYKTEEDVRNIVTGYGYATVADLPDMINQWAPGAELQYADGKLYFVDKDGNDRVVDIRGLDGQDGAQVELRKSDGQIQWRWTSGDDQSWHDLVALSELAGADGKSVDLDVISMSGIKNALVWKKEGETNSDWRLLYNLDNINGIDGCSVRAEKTYTETGTTVTLLKDCPGQQGHGDILVSFDVLNGADGTVTEEQIVDALENDETFKQLKTKVANLETNQSETYNLAMGVSNAVENPETGLAATNTLANKAWNKVKDLDPNVTTKDYVDSYVNGKIGDLDYDPTTYGKFASVAAKLGSIGNKTMKDYVDEKVRGVTTEINVDKGDDGFTYICKNGNACTSKPNSWDNQWERIDVDLSGYLKKETADNLYASFGTEVMARDAATAAAAAQTTANKAWGKLDDLGNKTVKSYVEDVVGVGSLGINPLTGVSYTVAGKLGFGQGTATQTVKEYIDEKFRSVNTEIMIADGPDGLMYICRKGNTCTTPAGPSNSYEWAAVSVDMSGYLTQNDADNRYATISALDNVKTTANEAKTTAAAAQQTANTAQSTAAAAQSTANDAWDKLNGLNGTVKEYVDDKVGSAGSTINVQTVNGVTYICRTGTCLDTPPSAYWAPIEVNISDEYLTEFEGNALYAPKAEYALKSDIGTLGGSFTSVGAKIGLNDYQYGNTSVKDYIDNKVSNISTNIQVQTSTVDGFTYICRTGNGCTGEPSQNPTQWAKVNVDLTSINTILTGFGSGTGQQPQVMNYINNRIGETGNNATYPYAQRSVVEYVQNAYVPLTRLGNEIGSGQTVAGYIGQQIGDTGTVYDYYSGQSRPKTVVEFVNGKIGNLNSYENVIAYGNANYAPKSEFDTLSSTVSGHTTLLGGLNGVTVKDYVDSKTPNIQIAPGSNGKMYYCTLATRCNTDYLDTAHGWQEFDISESLNLSTYLKTADAANTYLTIADAANTYAPKSVQTAVEDASTGLSVTNTTANNAWDKVKGLDYVSGLTDKTVTGYVAYRLGDITSGQTVKQYIDTHTPTITVKEGSDGNSYICTGTDCTGTPPGTGWTKLNVDLSGINAILAGFGGTDEPQTVKGYIGNMGSYNNQYGNPVAYTVETKIGLNSGDDASKTVKQYVDNKIGTLGNSAVNTPATSVADKLGTEITSANQTVAEYIASHSASIVVKPSSNGQDTYICTGSDCVSNATHPEDDAYDSSTNPNGNWTKLNVNLSGINAILTGFGSGEGNASTVKGYVDDYFATKSQVTAVDNRIGALGSNDGTPYTVATKLGLGTEYTNKTVAQYITDYVAANTSSGGVTTKTVQVDGVYKTYICSGDYCTGNPPCADGTYPDTCGWQELNINLTEYLKSDTAASTYLPKSGLRLVRNGEKIYLKQMNDDTVVQNYGEIADVSQFMCASYRMEKLESGDDGYVAGKESFKLICNTNE